MEKGSISVYFVKSAIAPVVARGGDADALLRKAGIAPALLKFSHGRVSAQHFSALWLGVAACLDDELFGQHARRMKVDSFVMLARTLVHSDDLPLALHTMVRFLNLILDDFHCALTVDAGRAGLTITQRPDAGGPRVMGHETLLMMMHGLACWLIGRRIPIVAASFAYPEPAASAEYLRMYCERLQFGQAATVLSFDTAYLDLKVVQDLRSARQFIAGAPANIVLKYMSPYQPPLYVQVANHIGTAIRKGQLKPNQALPAERLLAAKFSVSRVTARSAIKQLAQQGMIISRPGSGHYIRPVLQQPLSCLGGFSEELQNSGHRPGSRWVQRAVSSASAEEVVGLNLSPGARVARLERLRLADGVVVAYEVSALPESILPDPLAVNDSLYAQLALGNHSPVRALQHIRAINGSARLAGQLGVPELHAVLFITRFGYSAANQVVELTHSYCRSDYYDFVAEMKREDYLP